MKALPETKPKTCKGSSKSSTARPKRQRPSLNNGYGTCKDRSKTGFITQTGLPKIRSCVCALATVSSEYMTRDLVSVKQPTVNVALAPEYVLMTCTHLKIVRQ